MLRAELDPDVLERCCRAGVGDVLSGRLSRTLAIGPSTARTTSATLISAAGRPSQ